MICANLIFEQELDQLVALITEIWKKAAVGQVPTIVAASITHLAHKCTCYLMRDMDEYGIYDADELMARYEFAVESLKLCGPLPARSHLANAESRMGKSLQEGWHVIRDFKKDWRPGTPLNSTGVVVPFDDPWKFFQPTVVSQDPRGSEMTANREIFETLFRRMGQKFETDLSSSQAYVLTSPLLHEFQAFLDRDSRISQRRTAEHKEPETLSLAFGFQLLLQSSRAFYSPQGESSLIPKLNCRIQSLQLAGDLERHIQ